MNVDAKQMMIEAAELNGTIQTMDFKDAFEYLLDEFKNPEKIKKNQNSPYRLLYIGSFLINLDRDNREKARLLMSIENLASDKCLKEVFDFPLLKDDSG